jgi:hyperosmotically inducible protein
MDHTTTRKRVSVLVAVLSIFVSHLLVANQVNDNKLTAAVKAVLAQEKDIPESDITVSTKDGVVKLSGTVDTHLQAHRIAELTQSVNGVLRVDDLDLQTRSSTNFIRDAMITDKAKGKIQQLSKQSRIGKSYKLHIETTNGTVHVFGKVDKISDIGEIKDALSRMEHVKYVNFNLYS